MTLADLSSLSFERATTLDALCSMLAERAKNDEHTVLLAGGTDWVVEQELRGPFGAGDKRPLIVDISRLDALRGISEVDGRIRIGAATTFLEMRRNELIQQKLPMIPQMAKDIGAVQIQARGTFGGNLATASPAADGVAALAALDATLVVKSLGGERRIAFGELQTGYKTSTRKPDEVILAVEIEPPAADASWTWHKVGTRRAQAISKVALAGVVQRDKAGSVTRCGLGMASVAPTTALLREVRKLVLGSAPKGISAENVAAAMHKDIKPIDDVRSNADYRMHVAVAITQRFLRDADVLSD